MKFELAVPRPSCGLVNPIRAKCESVFSYLRLQIGFNYAFRSPGCKVIEQSDNGDQSNVRREDVIPSQLIRSSSPEVAHKINSLKEMTSEPEIQVQPRSRSSQGHGCGIQCNSVEKLTVNEESLASELESAEKHVTYKETTSDNDSNVSKGSDSETDEPTNFNSNNSNNISTNRDPVGDPAPWMEGDSELSDIEEVSETSDKLEHKLNHEMEHQLGLGEKPGFSCNHGNSHEVSCSCSPMVLYTKEQN